MDPRIEEVELPEKDGSPADYEVALVSLNQWQLAWRRFKKHKLALFGAFLFLGVVAIAIVGPLLLPYDPQYVPSFSSQYCEGSQTLKAYSGCPPFSAGHILGTTGSLRLDLLVLVVNGARISLIIGVGAALVATIIGTIVGGVAGYFGGVVDNLLMRFVDVLLSIPLLFVVIWMSKVIGNGDWRVLLLVFPIIVSTTLAVAAFIITEAFVSFLGFGVDPAVTPTWGNILTGGQDFIGQGNWWWTLFPGLAIVVTVLGINFMGDGLRDALDPRSRD